jgi:hypothetical protein
VLGNLVIAFVSGSRATLSGRGETSSFQVDSLKLGEMIHRCPSQVLLETTSSHGQLKPAPLLAYRCLRTCT